MAKLETIADIDFGALYEKHFKVADRAISDRAFWDDRATQLMATGADSVLSENRDDAYIAALLARIVAHENDTILDVGCGTGKLALSLAPKVKQVYGLDFSEKMLEISQRSAADLQVSNYQLILKSWYDNWDEVPICDICISSRSSMVSSIEAALDKLNDKARKAVYMTLVVDKEFVNRALYQLLNRDHMIRFPSYIYALNILYQQGYLVTVDFINNDGEIQQEVTSEVEFLRAVNMIVGDITDSEMIILREYYQNNRDHLCPLNTSSRIWALLSWQK